MFGFHPVPFHNHLAFGASPAPAAKLTYLGTRGVAQPVRLMLALNGVPFTETAPESKEEWETLKESLPYGQVPLLEIDGLKLVQTRAIVKYLGRKFGQYGVNLHNDYAQDAIMEATYDLQKTVVFPLMFMSGVKAVEDLPEDIQAKVAETLKAQEKFFTVWEKHLSATPGFPGFTKIPLSVADVMVYSAIEMLAAFPVAFSGLDAYPALKAWFERLSAHPRMAAFHASPQSLPWPAPVEDMQRVIGMINPAMLSKLPGGAPNVPPGEAPVPVAATD